MAASPAEPLAFGGRILCHPTAAGAASHDGAGRRFVFCPGPTTDPGYLYALDVECRDLPVPEALAARLGPQAMARWGELEVTAKLLDLPVHLLLRAATAAPASAPLLPAGLEICRLDTAQHWRVLGRRRRAGAEQLSPGVFHAGQIQAESEDPLE